jgi:protein-S-isoprenylcysteine O-methyltransferase Ste14
VREGKLTDTAWYFRLFYVPILNMLISMALFRIMNAKRMTSTGPGTSWALVYFIGLTVWCVLMWFVPFSLNVAFWIGICIMIFGQVIFALGYSAMREHPEKNKLVVDWGIYKFSRHSHVLAGKVTTLGAIAMGWNWNSRMYVILWLYFVLDIIVTHFGVLNEEKINREKFGPEYEDYMKRVPRYL